MIALILGSNGSGKSVYAEKFITRFSSGARYYIATMIPYGAEGRARVERHRKQREPMEFITMEAPFGVSEISLSRGANVLLEDVSNLLSNALFDGRRNGNAEGVFTDVAAMCEKCANAVLVSIGGLTGQPEYNDETREFVDSLNELNRRLSDFADIVITLCDGTPSVIKGDVHALV